MSPRKVFRKIQIRSSNVKGMTQGLVILKDVAVHVPQEEWKYLDSDQKDFYTDTMLRNYIRVSLELSIFSQM